MTRTEAAEILGIVDISEASVNGAYRALSKTCHPNGQTPDAALWERIAVAKATLLEPPPPCPACKGEGRQRSGAMTRWCTECGGTGHS